VDDEYKRVVPSEFAKTIDVADEYCIREMQSVVEACRLIFVAVVYLWKSGRHIIWMMSGVDIDDGKKRRGAVLRPREGAVRDFPVVDAPTVERVLVLVSLRHALRDQLLVERQQIVEAVHVFAVEECGGEEAVALA